MVPRCRYEVVINHAGYARSPQPRGLRAAGLLLCAGLLLLPLVSIGYEGLPDPATLTPAELAALIEPLAIKPHKDQQQDTGECQYQRKLGLDADHGVFEAIPTPPR